MNKKKLLIMGLICVATLCFTACGKEYSGPEAVSDNVMASDSEATVVENDICKLITHADDPKYPEEGIYVLDPMSLGVEDKISDIIIGSNTLDPKELFKESSEAFNVAVYLNQFFEFESNDGVHSKNQSESYLKEHASVYHYENEDDIATYVFNFKTEGLAADVDASIATNDDAVELPADVDPNRNYDGGSIILTIKSETLEDGSENMISYELDFNSPGESDTNYVIDPTFEELLYYADLLDGRKAMFADYSDYTVSIY